MTEHRRGVALTPMETRRDVILRTALLAEELGYELVSVPEGWGLDSVPLLTEIALRTQRIRIVSGILSIWGRTPATLAMTAATLHEVSGGRFILGLGASTRALAEGFHDAPFVHVVDRLRRTACTVRTLLGGEAPNLSHATSARPLRLGVVPTPDVPIWLAALGERSVQVVRDLGDGWLPLYIDRARLQALRSCMKPARPLTIAAGPMVIANEDSAAARQIAASVTACYVAAMGDVYSRSLANNGYAADVAAIKAANPRPRPDCGLVPSEAQRILDEFTAYGTSACVRDRLDSWEDAADIVLVGCAPGLPWETLEGTLRAAAPW
jgi:alkanesulfonate monooxygenase SsuD/methylene tetrahydromethanopterin reductase-like flavin-dependent oxidoreductase (luciferase family)